MATKKQSMVDVAILRTCYLGAPGEIVTLSSEEADAAEQQGMVDSHPDAVKALKSK